MPMRVAQSRSHSEEINWAHSALSTAEQRSVGLADGHFRLLVLVETAAAVLNAASIAAHERVAALILGSEDLALALGVEPTLDLAGICRELRGICGEGSPEGTLGHSILFGLHSRHWPLC